MKEKTGRMSLNSLQVLGVGVTGASGGEVLGFLTVKLQKGEKFWLATPNPEMVVKANREVWFKKLLNHASVCLPDGIGLVWASKILYPGRGLKERVAGADFMVTLCREAEKKGWKVFFLGGRGGVAKVALEALKKRFPGLRGQVDEGPTLVIEKGKLKIEKEKENERTIEIINQFQPHLLFVGFGMGKQEAWIDRFLPRLKIGGAMVVGGSFNFLSGRVRRAPEAWQKAGFEWLWRLILQPWRIRRQLALLEFVFLLVKERFLNPVRSL